jgi:hypothetical protein
MNAVPFVGGFVPSKHYFRALRREFSFLHHVLDLLNRVSKGCRGFFPAVNGRRVKLITSSHKVSKLRIFEILSSFSTFTF